MVIFSHKKSAGTGADWINDAVLYIFLEKLLMANIKKAY
jgi:hypothetical protein